LDIQVRQWWICMLLFSADKITQYTVGLATDVPVEFLTVGDVYLAPAFLNTIAYLASIPNPPSVVTTSYIANEAQFSLSDAQFVFVVRLFSDLTHAHRQEYLCWLHGAWRSRHLGDQYPPARIFLSNLTRIRSYLRLVTAECAVRMTVQTSVRRTLSFPCSLPPVPTVLRVFALCGKLLTQRSDVGRLHAGH
jgi:hypothetical protein